ncbi:DUF58 domain-containing protein [Mycobacterium sp. ITM-2016-00316]|uniref:DUF58 domain-containing protein n=1 Tax=Mycobacterium sp. ITM-2016-00316 TaxID=2099695 RepID=UPI000CFA2412|nr:DUF58 domain-containing protein [Mycobacterium sp. ITM-2016-00316]WNG81959.1 DUF58 domain-containing protein [Mycobacterium sp. ITM-2016-00316]
MGKHLDAAKAHVSRDAARLLAGGRYALVHTRSLEFDELRPYVPGDDVRDIDWKASARSGHTLIKQFVSEKHHKILIVADTGRNTAALTPTGQPKSEVAAHIIGAVGLITLPRSDEIGMVAGDRRGSIDIRLRRGETHIERILHRFLQQTDANPDRSDIVTQLEWVARHYRHPMLIVVVSDEPELDQRLREVLLPLTGRHDVLWAMVTDMPAIGTEDSGLGYDVADGRTLLGADILGERVIMAYRQAEEQRRRELSEFLTARRIPHARIASSSGIMPALVAMTGVYARAG